MNAPVKLPSVIRNRFPAVLSGDHHKSTDHLEFLPANLEIIETPASPRAGLFLWTLCALLAGAFAWSWFGTLDIHAVAKGRIQPSGRSKVVQPLEPGRVRAIMVANGEHVRAGDTLIELDPTDSEADRAAFSAQLESLKAEIARRTVAIDSIRNPASPSPIPFPSGVSKPIQIREESALAADLNQFHARRESLLAQRGELEARRRRLDLSVVAREKLISSLQERVNMRETLASSQSGTRAAVIDALQLLQGEQTSLAYDQGQLLETDASTKLNESRVKQLTEEFVAEQTRLLVDAQRKHGDTEQAVVKAEAKAARTKMVAPIDGVVQQLAVTTVGQVVVSGQPLMVVVPSDSPLEVEALIENQDIGFVRPGQEVIVKVDSFPFTRYGTLDGVVRRVSSDAVDQRDAGATADATTAARSMNAGTLSGVSRVQNLVYPVTIELSKWSIYADGRDVQLGPGMMVTAEVRTGSRRVIDYLLAPLREIGSQAGRER